MPDEPIPDPSPSERPGASENTSPEDEIDALLAEAASLASDVTGEVGVPEEQPASSQATHPAGQTDGPVSDIDTQLAELDGLLEETYREVGNTTPATDDADPVTLDNREPADSDADSALQQPGSSSPSADTEEAGPTPPGGPDTPAPAPSTSPTENPATDFDADLTALDDLLDQVGHEGDAEQSTDDASSPQADVESEAPPSEQGAVPDPMQESKEPEGEVDASPEATKQPPAEDGAAAVPDFMAEFTTPEPGTEAGTPAASDGTQPASATAHVTGEGTSPKPQDVSSHERGVVSNLDVTSPEMSAVSDADLLEELDEAGSAKVPKARSPGPAKRLLGRVAAPVSPLALKACEGGLRALEAMDRPTQRLGYWPRRLIGWLAVATLGTSLIVYVISLF